MTDAGHGLDAIGYGAYFADQLPALGGAFTPARIAIAHGESYIAWTDRGACKAVLAGKQADRWQQAIDRPQVGDWVAGTSSESGDALSIEHLLARRTCLMRQASGGRGAAQVIAANVGGTPPTITSLYNDPALFKNYPFHADILQALLHASVRPKSPVYQVVSIDISHLVSPPSGISPQSAEQSMVRQLNNALQSKGLVP